MATRSARAKRAWTRLTEWYGARMVEQFGKLCPDEWARVFDSIDQRRLDLALARLKRESPKHPPTLGLLESLIPPKHTGPPITQQLCTYAVDNLKLCAHQLMRNWNYFGQGLDVRGVEIPACAECEQPQRRITTDQIT